MSLDLWTSKMRTGQAVKRVKRDLEFAYSADPSTRILRFGNLEARGLRKMSPIKLRDTNVVIEKRQQRNFTKGLVMVRSSFCKPRVMVVQIHVST